MDVQGIFLLQDELRTARPEVLEITEGLRDYLRLNLNEETRVYVEALLKDYERRDAYMEGLRVRLDAAEAAVNALLADNYPVLPTLDIGAVPYKDLADNLHTIGLARNKFIERLLTVSGTLTAGPEEPIA